jgi:DNA-binding response OmpR family regulator
MTRILLVEDELSLAVGLVDVLQVKGYQVEHVADGELGLARALSGEFALLLLDAMLPGVSGFDILRQVRAKGLPTSVIMVTARGTEMDRVLGFELGVDDYVTKPFSLLELLGRIAAVLRRSPAPAAAPDSQLQFGDVTIDFERFVVKRGGAELALPARAFEILKVLAARQGQVVTRDALMDDVWGVDEAITLRTLNNVMVKIRQAIEVNPEEPVYLKTVHGVGYRLELGAGKKI